ncbi:PL29 family lyase N-terminal domain-containing protein [Niabella yanshanensis]|uniref:PL29 family lyase N-terminal domain-containing protein n=1 Tax=Niabella yanshanensis TaxID=577386 RepID=A0ABZ0WD89_9BACT|nr:PL29 family lyase N-terminal domain-containing protein [Niabella yanshanensis]WQD40664.1 PL29 family lyase N-terminal domain-containing protein [Niabella yanshanensis]
MKKVIFLSLLLWVLAACQKKDIRELRSELNRQKDLIAQLQSALQSINTDMKTLQAIATALQAKISVVSYTATPTGYELIMSDGSKINLTNGKDGTNGANGTNGKDGVNAPLIGLRQNADGNYYWTIGGDWLLQNGQKVKANGTNGANGSNGVNGITPLLMVNATSNQWMVSYDSGNTWSVIKDGNGNPITATGATGAIGPQGPQGPAGITNFGITETETSIIITYNGNTYTLSKIGIVPTCNIGDLPSITFRGLTVILSNDAKGLLSSAAQRMRSNPDCKIIVKGYNCSTSLAERQRSWDRVKNVIDHLVQNEGISASRFIFQYSQSGRDCEYVDLAGANQNQTGGGTVPPRPTS